MDSAFGHFAQRPHGAYLWQDPYRRDTAHALRVLQPSRPFRITGPRTEPDRHRLANNVFLLDGLKPLEPDVVVVILDESVIALDMSVTPDDRFAVSQIEQMPVPLSVRSVNLHAVAVRQCEVFAVDDDILSKSDFTLLAA